MATARPLYTPDNFCSIAGQPDLLNELSRYQLFLLKIQRTEFQVLQL